MISAVTPLAAIQTMLFLFAAFAGFAAWLVYLWAVRDGQFKDVEEPAEDVVDA